MPLRTMWRDYLLQQWCNLPDPQAEDLLHDTDAMRRFARIDLRQGAVPDASMILRFRRLLEARGLTAQMFAAVRGLLEEQRLLLEAGTIVDATIIGAPRSTKHATQTRDPAMRQTKKGTQWYFGMKVHVGTDRLGVIHTVTTTDAATDATTDATTVATTVATTAAAAHSARRADRPRRMVECAPPRAPAENAHA